MASYYLNLKEKKLRFYRAQKFLHKSINEHTFAVFPFHYQIDFICKIENNFSDITFFTGIAF